MWTYCNNFPPSILKTTRSIRIPHTHFVKQKSETQDKITFLEMYTFILREKDWLLRLHCSNIHVHVHVHCTCTCTHTQA